MKIYLPPVFAVDESRDGNQIRQLRHPARLIVTAQDGPVVLVGHSDGGVVITEAGNEPKVTRLVYVAAFAPGAGESVSALIKGPPPGGPRRERRRRPFRVAGRAQAVVRLSVDAIT